jgi:thiamine pyrophosphokinase
MQNDTTRLGLLFTGGEGPLPSRITGIAEEAAALPGVTTISAAADSGLLLAESAGIKSDWIIGDMDSLGAEAGRLDAYASEKVLRYPKDKDFTDTELAFFLLREKGCKSIWIIGGGGGRLDQLFGIRSLFEREDPPERWITAVEDIYCIEGSDGLSPNELSSNELNGTKRRIPAKLQKQCNAAVFPVSVFPLGTGPWEAESSGLKWPLSGLNWARDFIAISNEASEGNFTITAKRGRFMVMVPLGIQQGSCFV